MNMSNFIDIVGLCVSIVSMLTGLVGLIPVIKKIFGEATAIIYSVVVIIVLLCICSSSTGYLLAKAVLYVYHNNFPNSNDIELTSTSENNVGLSLQCDFNWFFTFSPQYKVDYCPSQPKMAGAVGQDFEGGRVLFYPSKRDGEPDTIYVIYNDLSWSAYQDTWGISTQQNSLEPEYIYLTIPANRFQPIGNIGKVWDEETEVRTRLGWAYSSEVSFLGWYQEDTNFPFCLYLAHGKMSKVIRLCEASSNHYWEYVGTRWES